MINEDLSFTVICRNDKNRFLDANLMKLRILRLLSISHNQIRYFMYIYYFDLRLIQNMQQNDY